VALRGLGPVAPRRIASTDQLVADLPDGGHMKAAVLHAWGQSPRYEDFSGPPTDRGRSAPAGQRRLAEERRQDDGEWFALRPPPRPPMRVRR